MNGFNSRNIGSQPLKKGQSVTTSFYGYPVRMSVVSCIPYDINSQTGWKVKAISHNGKVLVADAAWFKKDKFQ